MKIKEKILSRIHLDKYSFLLKAWIHGTYLGFSFLHSCFKMVNSVSDFIDLAQKDIELTTTQSRESMQCPDTDNIVKQFSFEFISGNTASSQYVLD